MIGGAGIRRCTCGVRRAGTWREERSDRSAEGKKKRRSKQVNDLNLMKVGYRAAGTLMNESECSEEERKERRAFEGRRRKEEPRLTIVACDPWPARVLVTDVQAIDPKLRRDGCASETPWLPQAPCLIHDWRPCPSNWPASAATPLRGWPIHLPTREGNTRGCVVAMTVAVRVYSRGCKPWRR